MTKTVFRYFFDFMEEQEKWLNKMAEKGYRLKRCGKLSYVFESCNPNEYEYAVEFVADKSYSKSKDYKQFLESMGLHTFTKNINLNFSIGKIKWRPYAKGMGQIATSPSAFNKELLIVEKKRDGNPFKLHTDLDDLIPSYRAFRNAYFWVTLCLLAFFVITFIPYAFTTKSNAWLYMVRIVAGILTILFLSPAIKYSAVVKTLKKERRTHE